MKLFRFVLLGLFAATACGAPAATSPLQPSAATLAPSLVPTQAPTLTPTATLTPTPAPTPTLMPGAERTRPLTNMKQVYVPAGAFTMGTDEEDAQPSAKPAHTVNLEGFWIDQTEVTNAMYLACFEAEVCTTPAYGIYKGGKTKGDLGSGWKRKQVEGSFVAQEFDAPDAGGYPVVDVSWEQAEAFCAWAGEALPTEAQWEKAARGTDGRPFPWGDTLPSRGLINNFYGQPIRVGSYPSGASPYGALDMAGNVWEFVADWYGRDYYRTSPVDNPTGPERGFAHVIRGGSYSNVDPAGQTVATYNRNFEGGPGFTSHVGFRCASSEGGAAAGGAAGVTAMQSAPAPAATRPAPRALPAIPIEYGETKGSLVREGTIYYSFEGSEGDDIVVRIQVSNAHPTTRYCQKTMNANVEVRTDQFDLLETAAVSSSPKTMKIYRLPYRGLYYIYATCTGSGCITTCAQEDVSLEQK